MKWSFSKIHHLSLAINRFQRTQADLAWYSILICKILQTISNFLNNTRHFEPINDNTNMLVWEGGKPLWTYSPLISILFLLNTSRTMLILFDPWLPLEPERKYKIMFANNPAKYISFQYICVLMLYSYTIVGD